MTTANGLLAHCLEAAITGVENVGMYYLTFSHLPRSCGGCCLGTGLVVAEEHAWKKCTGPNSGLVAVSG